MGCAQIVGIALIFIGLAQSYEESSNLGVKPPNKDAGPGLWNSIGENIKTPGEALPTQMSDSSEQKAFPGLLSSKMFHERQADEALGHEDETIMVRPPWRRPHHYWIMRQEKKRRQAGNA